MSLKSLFDWKGNLGLVYILIGVSLALIDIGIVGYGSYTFWYGLTYAAAIGGIGVVLSRKEPSFLASLFASLAVLTSVVSSLNLAPTFLTADVAAALSGGLFIAVLVFEFAIPIWKNEASRYFTLIALAALAVFSLTYFWARLTTPTSSLNFYTVLYHGSLMALAGFDLLTLLRANKIGKAKIKDYIAYSRTLLAVITIIGALLLTGLVGWGLTLLGH